MDLPQPPAAVPSTGAPASFRKPRLEAAIGWLAACGLVFLASVTVIVGVQSRERALANAQDRALAAVRVLAEHAARLFDAADLLVEYAVQETTGLDWDGIAGSRTLWERLDSQRARLPFLDAVWLNDQTGQLRLTTIAFPSPPSDASDREMFHFHRANPDRPYISERIVGRITNKASFLLSRRLSAPDGAFRGMASVTIDPAYLSGFYKELELSYEPVTAMVRDQDLSVLVREPDRSAGAPTPLSETGRRAIRATPAGGIVSDESIIFAHRQVENWPVHVVVQHDVAPVLDAWSRAITPYVGLAAAAALALLALSLFGFRQARAARLVQSELEARVRDRTASLEQAVGERDSALAEKDLLMREVNHRIKNSLQVVSSLLSLQAQSAGDLRLRAQLDEAGRRVQAISDIHRLLYRIDDVRFIPFHDYLTALCRDLERSALSEGGGWRLELAVEPVEVPTDQAVPLGLIANELVMNAIKHAYPDRRADGPPHPIAVGLAREPSGAIRLTVSDHGVGLPAGFDWRRSRSLGMRLVHTLSGQLGATLAVEPIAPGTRFTVRMPAARPA
ncbi:two-component sensor histidine kinase [Azospirillum agricola]|uniref:sensor histidine kinase n=1 Tax=Azospirillum agricola TaxID=1720247 RepID=UPI001AE1FBB5|nr:histidine kinase dimerization/phosphoacceptor domain -containing protein [Azospirillum agricola]MBP2232253.1 two-component sensor histidine kinase [Azospirillum agricola]